MESLASDIPAGDGKIVNLFLQCRVRLRAHRGRASANKQCPGAGQAPVEETRPGEAQDYVV
jgi:hypothetical protein